MGRSHTGTPSRASRCTRASHAKYSVLVIVHVPQMKNDSVKHPSALGSEGIALENRERERERQRELLFEGFTAVGDTMLSHFGSSRLLETIRCSPFQIGLPEW